MIERRHQAPGCQESALVRIERSLYTADCSINDLYHDALYVMIVLDTCLHYPNVRRRFWRVLGAFRPSSRPAQTHPRCC